jgi:DNA-binding transcriptional ArsR family regulator
VITNTFSALADPTRRKVLELVAERPRAVSQLADQLPVSRPAVSQHLKILHQAGLVQERRAGTRHIYSLDTAGLEILRAYLDSFWERSLASFKAAVEEAERLRASAPTTAEETP